jgi:hypothetical protein
MKPPQTRESWEHLRHMTRKQALAAGLVSWNGSLFLFPADWFPAIPDGFAVVSIFGESKPFSATMGNDSRFGALAYGIRLDSP